MKTVLMIAPYFVPRRRVGSYRPYKFVKHLKSFGWNPVVITIGGSGESLTPNERKALEGVEIKEIRPPFDRTTKSASNNDSEIRHRVWARWADWLAEWFDRQIPMDAWIFLFRSAYGEISEFSRSIEPDLIWSTGDPWSGHWLGNKLSKELKKPWIADFRDPWTLSGLRLRKRSVLSDFADRKLEQKFIKEADKVVFTAKAAEDLYRDTYSLQDGKTDTIYNSFELTGEEEPGAITQSWGAEIDPAKLNLVFFGSFRRLSPIQPVAESLAELPVETREQIRVHSFGRLEPEDEKYLERLGVSELFLVHEKVVPEMAGAVFQEADILLVSTSGERRSIIPAKLWEYMISDKPIVSITPNPEIGEILKQTGAGIHFQNGQTRDIASALKQALENKKIGEPVFQVDRKRERISQFSAKKNTQKLAQIMDTLTGDER